MNDLLNLAVEAHRGLKRWSRVESRSGGCLNYRRDMAGQKQARLSEERSLQGRDEKGARHDGFSRPRQAIRLRAESR